MTSEIGFIEADHATALRAWLEWWRTGAGSKQIDVEEREIHGELESLLRSMAPLAVGRATHYLFVPTSGRWTALFDNGWRGSDVGSSVVSLAAKLRCRGMRVVAQPNTMRKGKGPARGRYGAVMLEIYGPEIEVVRALPPSPIAGEVIAVVGKRARALVAMNDGGRWRFNALGEPLPFEQPEHYTAPRIRDRFTFAMLRDYLTAMGIQAFDADFYAPDKTATLVELVGMKPLGEYSLEEVQAQF